MIIVLKPDTSKKEIRGLIEDIKRKGLKPVEFEGLERTVIHVLGNLTDDFENHLISVGQRIFCSPFIILSMNGNILSYECTGTWRVKSS